MTLYQIVQGTSPADLGLRVSVQLAEGWHLSGGVAVAMTEERHYQQGDELFETVVLYAQAMVKL